MRIGDVVLFSRDLCYSDIPKIWDDREKLITAYQNRMEWLFVEPANRLNEQKAAFSSALLTMCAMDSIIRLQIGTRTSRSCYDMWLTRNVPDVSSKCPDFYDIFRCGLVHEGRAKYGHQLSYQYHDVIEVYRGKYLLNPDTLLKCFYQWLLEYTDNLRTDYGSFVEFKINMWQMIKEDVNSINLDFAPKNL